MKNINYVIDGVLALAVLILFIMQFGGKKETGTPSAAIVQGEAISGQLPIAYVNIDSLLLNYNYYMDLNEQLMKKEENSRLNLNQRKNDFMTEVQDFQRKVENNVFLTRERAEQEQRRLANKQTEIEELEERLTRELWNDQQKVTEQLRDSLLSQVRAFNETKGYQVIFSNTNGDNILWADDAYDVTKEVIELLNRNYSSTAK